MEEPASTMKAVRNSAVTVTFFLMVKDVKDLLHAMEIRVIMVVHALLHLKRILSWV